MVAWVTLCLTVTLSAVIYASVDDAHRFDTIQKLQEVLGLPHNAERRHHQAVPQFMTELYENIVGASQRRNPYNAKVVRSFVEKDTSSAQYFFFNISGLDVTERVLEAQLHLYRMKSRPQDGAFTSPIILVRVYQVLDEEKLHVPDSQRLLSSHMVAAHSTGWEVFNVKEAVLDWVTHKRKNKGLLVTCNTLFEQAVESRFVRRNEHHNSKQPILVLFDDDNVVSSPLLAGKPDYYRYGSIDESGRRRRSLSALETSGNITSSTGECARSELYIDFEKIGWSSWIIAPKGYSAYYCKGHCNFPLGQSQRPSNHATVQSLVHEMHLEPDVGKPCCVPASLLALPLLFLDDDDSVVLRNYEDMIADSCGCQ